MMMALLFEYSTSILTVLRNANDASVHLLKYDRKLNAFITAPGQMHQETFIFHVRSSPLQKLQQQTKY